LKWANNNPKDVYFMINEFLLLWIKIAMDGYSHCDDAKRLLWV